MEYIEMKPAWSTLAPFGGLIDFSLLTVDQIGWIGDDGAKVAVDRDGKPTPPDAHEQVLSRWIAETTDPKMFEVTGTTESLEQGTITNGSTTNNVLLTSSHLRVAVQYYKSTVRTSAGVKHLQYGSVYAFAIDLVNIELIDGNKRDIGLATSMEGLTTQWVRMADEQWKKSGPKGLWRKDNTAFGQALLAATIAAKQNHPDANVRASADQAATLVSAADFASGRRTSFDFARPPAPTNP